MLLRKYKIIFGELAAGKSLVVLLGIYHACSRNIQNKGDGHDPRPMAVA